MEDNSENMKEIGPNIGIGTAIRNEFGDFAPRNQEYGGNAGKSPEQRESEAMSRWINKVKDSVQKGEAVAFVHDRTNFDIDPQGKPILRRNDGYQNRMLRGKGLDDNTADAIRNLTGDIEHNQKYEMNRLEGDEAGLPRENDRKSDTLYVSIAHVPDLPITSYSQIKHPAVNIESSVVELRYKQPKGDDAGTGRTGEKRVIMVLPIETAYELQHMIEDGVDPNLLRNNVSAIFTSKEGADWYDSNLLDRMKTRDDTPVLKVKADKPYLAETFLQVTKPGGNERQILADKFIIKPGEHQPNEATPKTPVENKKDDIKHEQFAVSGAKILASKGPSQLTDIDKLWVDNNKGILQGAIARGDLDAEAGRRLGIAENQPVENKWADFEGMDWDFGKTPQKDITGVRPEDLPEINKSKTAAHKPPQERYQSRVVSNNQNYDQRPRPDLQDENGGFQNIYEPEYLILQGIENIPEAEREYEVNRFIEKVEVEYPETAINSLPGNISKAMRSLEGILKRYDQDPNHKYPIDVKTIKLARARIRVHDMNVAAQFLNFKPDEIKGDIRSKFQNIAAGGRLIDGEDMAVLLKGRIDVERYKNIEFGEKLQVGEALNILQSAAVEGVYGLRSDGKPVYWGDKRLGPDDQRNLIIKIKAMLPPNCDKEATFRLADRISKITFEASVWDTSGSDPVSQVIYMEGARRSVIDKINPEKPTALETSVTSEDYGPEYTIDMVPGFGTSLIRRATYKDKATGDYVRLVHNREWRDAVGKIRNAGKDAEMVEQGMNMALAINRVDKEVTTSNLPINFKALKYEELPANVFSDYYSKYLPALKTTEAYLLKSDWKPSDFTKDKINDMYVAFRYSDPGDVFYLRGTFIAGVLEENLKGATTEEKNAGTFKDSKALKKFLDVLVKPQGGQKVTFMTKAEMKALKDAVKPFVHAELYTFLEDAFGPILATSR